MCWHSTEDCNSVPYVNFTVLPKFEVTVDLPSYYLLLINRPLLQKNLTVTVTAKWVSSSSLVLLFHCHHVAITALDITMSYWVTCFDFRQTQSWASSAVMIHFQWIVFNALNTLLYSVLVIDSFQYRLSSTKYAATFLIILEIRSVEHGICPIAEFTSPLLSCAAILAIRP